MNILVINCGSSSLKFQLIDMTTEAVQAKGLCERIGIDGSRIVYTPAGGEKMTIESPMPTHTEAIKLVLDCWSAPRQKYSLPHAGSNTAVHPLPRRTVRIWLRYIPHGLN